MDSNKTPGITRRVDDLGRVVIPKEIRRAYRIKEGDPLEIIVTENGILLKKYSPMSTIAEYAEEYSSSLHESTGHMIYITDRDRNIAVKGVPKKGNLNEPIDSTVENVIRSYKEKCINENNVSRVIVPIIVCGDVVGTVIISSDEVVLGELEMKLAQTAAGFLGHMLENY